MSSPPPARWERVEKSYRYGWGSASALNGFSLEVAEGEVRGLLGANGSGKTTAAGVLLGLLEPDAGSVSLFGRDPSQHEARQRVGFLPEEYETFPAMTPLAQLEMVARLKGLAADERNEHVQEVLESLQLDRARKQRFDRLSRGMRRRVGLAGALLGEPDLIVLDEPTTGLDPRLQNRFHRIVRNRRESGLTSLIITHRLGEIRRACDRVSLIERGRVRLTGPPDRVLREVGRSDE